MPYEVDNRGFVTKIIDLEEFAKHDESYTAGEDINGSPFSLDLINGNASWCSSVDVGDSFDKWCAKGKLQPSVNATGSDCLKAEGVAQFVSGKHMPSLVLICPAAIDYPWGSGRKLVKGTPILFSGLINVNTGNPFRENSHLALIRMQFPPAVANSKTHTSAEEVRSVSSDETKEMPNKDELTRETNAGVHEWIAETYAGINENIHSATGSYNPKLTEAVEDQIDAASNSRGGLTTGDGTPSPSPHSTNPAEETSDSAVLAADAAEEAAYAADSAVEHPSSERLQPEQRAVTATTPQSASFDCSAARLPSERAICSDPRLKAADGQMGMLYRQIMRSHDDAAGDSLRAEQRIWLRSRNQRCQGDVTCLSNYISVRTQELRSR